LTFVLSKWKAGKKVTNRNGSVALHGSKNNACLCKLFNFLTMKKSTIIPAFFIFFLIGACTNNSGPVPAAIKQDSNLKIKNADTVSNSIATVSTDTLGSNDNDFIIKAARTNSMEIMMANAALAKTINDPIKRISKTIVDENTQLNIKLKSIVQSRNIAFPEGVNESQKMEIDAISKQQGRNFDTVYLNNMIENIKADLEYYTKASTHLGDKDLRDYAAGALPILLQHFDALKAIKKGL
jgi:predicted outer membrane protein